MSSVLSRFGLRVVSVSIVAQTARLRNAQSSRLSYISPVSEILTECQYEEKEKNDEDCKNIIGSSFGVPEDK